MAHLKINGYPVRVSAGGEVSFNEVSGHREYSFNGLYQFSRNAIARQWQFTTHPMPKNEALSLAGMLNMQGDAWRWSLGSTAPDGVHYIAADTASTGWTDKRRIQQNAEAVATVVSAYGADGARVYDWNGNAYAPFSGCDGAVLVEPGTTNLLTANESNPESGALGWSATSGSATVAASTSVYWTGAGSARVDYTAAAAGATASATSVAINTDYVFSVYVRLSTTSQTIRLATIGDSSGSTTTDYIISGSLDRWHRLYHTVTTDGADTTLTCSVRGILPSPSGTFYLDGAQLEADAGDGYPTAWVNKGTNPWGSGNGVRPAGVLDYDTFLSTYTKGLTVSAWVNLQKLSPASTQYVFDGGDGNPRCGMYINTSNGYEFVIRASDGSQLNAGVAGLSAGWNHLVATYGPDDTTLRMYLNGALSVSDSTWSAARQKWDVENITGDLSIGSAGTAGANNCPGPIGPVQVFPFAAPLKFIQGLYNSGGDQTIVPGLMPLGVSGTALGAGETDVACYSKVDAVTNLPHYSSVTNAWEDGAATVTFTLYEAAGR